MKLLIDILRTPLAPLFCAVRGDGVVARLNFLDKRAPRRSREALISILSNRGHELERKTGVARHVEREVRAFLRGRSQKLKLDLIVEGTPFQKEIWKQLRRVRYGSTITYAELASRVGYPNAVRAAARANATNPITIVIPSHRVLGSDGSLAGFDGGVNIKRSLLELEGSLEASS